MILQSSFSELTVKELRQLVKESSDERGLLSRLKRKQDLIAYLESNGGSSTTNGVREVVSNDADGKASPRIRRMPSKESAKHRRLASDSTFKSPKDAIFEQVYQRYPELRDEEKSDGADVDVRQKRHPVLANNSKSDMDIVFVGTASCTPGVTRGVSCTALRLNWKRRAAPYYNGASTSFEGGTWLFDVGECTQVSSDGWFDDLHMTRHEMLAPV
jgi:hypothetical protein